MRRIALLSFAAVLTTDAPVAHAACWIDTTGLYCSPTCWPISSALQFCVWIEPLLAAVFTASAAIGLIIFFIRYRSNAWRSIDHIGADITRTNNLTARMTAVGREADEHIAKLRAELGRLNGDRGHD